MYLSKNFDNNIIPFIIPQKIDIAHVIEKDRLHVLNSFVKNISIIFATFPLI